MLVPFRASDMHRILGLERLSQDAFYRIFKLQDLSILSLYRILEL